MDSCEYGFILDSLLESVTLKWVHFCRLYPMMFKSNYRPYLCSIYLNLNGLVYEFPFSSIP